MRKKLIIGNWKMNLSLNEAVDLVNKLNAKLHDIKEVEVGVCPSFVYLSQVCEILKKSNIFVGAQNMFYKESGAFTGEVSPKMLKDFNVKCVLVGHSERRQVFKESDSDINLKIKAALKVGLTPVFCVGEELSVRESGAADDFVKRQVISGLDGLTHSDIEKLIIAYEPIWAIGTGKICSGADANKIIKMIRLTLKEKSTEAISSSVQILYGGSVKSDNFSEHISFPDIDGGLVGGASLSADEFIRLVNLCTPQPVK